MEIIESILTRNPCYMAGKKIKVGGLMLHSVGCPQPSAETFIKKWNDPASGRACVHAFIDGNTGKVYQTLPWDHRAWHCGGSGNNIYIGVEMCEPGCIRYTGGSTFSCSDEAAAKASVTRTYNAAVELFAYLCKQYGLNPLADGVIISHKEGHTRGIASGHGDPEHLWSQLKTGYTMNGFRQAVSQAMGQCAGTSQAGQPADTAKPQEIMPGAASNANACSTGGVQTGDTVRIAADATYYDGKAMPSWVKSDQWIVKSINGDRAVIDKNVSGKNAINSPVHIKYLMAAAKGTGGVSQAAPTPQTAPNPQAAAPSQAASQPSSSGTAMKISAKGVSLVAKYEGCRLEAYKCPAGVWTIGYGHTAGVNPGDRLPSQDAAKALLEKDLEKYAGYVNSCVQKGQICFKLTQNQFDALTSFTYNCGAGNLKKLVEGRDANAIADKLLQYNKGGGKVLAGLTKRREEERALFLS